MLARASKVSKSYGVNTIFRDLDFEIGEGDKIALIGENGTGKSTLFRLLSGQTQPDSGTIAISHGIEVGYLEQEPLVGERGSVFEVAMGADVHLVEINQGLRKIEEEMSSAGVDERRMQKLLEKYGRLQDQFGAAGGYEYEARVRSVLQGLRFSEDQLSQPTESLSGGEKKMVALARLLVRAPDLLLLDEPDNHLDLAAKSWLEEYILNHRGAVAIISHDRYFLDRFINHIFELEDGKIYEYRCNYSGFREEKQQRLEREHQQYELQKRQLKDLEKSAERLTRWAALNNKFAGRAKNRRRMLAKERERLENTPKPVIDRATMQLTFGQEERSGRLALELANLSVGFNGLELVEPFNLTIRYGERIGMVGPNGSGKTSLLKVILGHLKPLHGSVRVGANVKIGYYAQEQESLPMDETPVNYLRRIKPMHEGQAVSHLRSRLLFDYQECHSAIRFLSGGQRSRLQLAGLALSGVNFLVLDEPTNNLDIPSMMVLEDALLDFEGTILTVSHDRYFLDVLVDKIIAVHDKSINEYPGNFSDFFETTQGTIDIGVAPTQR